MIDPTDLRIEPLKSYPTGGQQVYPGPRDSGVRVTHIPTQTVVEVMIDRSQLQNKIRALAGIQAIVSDMLRKGASR